MKMKKEKRNFKFCAFAVLLLSCSQISLFGAEISPNGLDPTNLLIALSPQRSPGFDAAETTIEISTDANTPAAPKPTVGHRNTGQGQSQTTGQSVGTAGADFATRINQELIQTSSAAQKKSDDQFKYHLWQDDITVPQSQLDNRGENELQNLIEQISSIEFKPPAKGPEPIITVEPESTIQSQPAQTQPNSGIETKVPQKPQKPQNQIKPQLSYQPVSEQTLKMLDNLIQQPEQLDNPFELAEILYLSGHLKEAAVFYQEALNRQTAETENSVQNRPWILFQIGNCLRNHDASTATKMYGKLLAEFPKSDWADLARAENELINWYQQDKPRTLIAEK